MSVTTEVIRRVYDNDNGVFIEIGPDLDGLGCVELRTVGKESTDYYGKFNIIFCSKEQLKMLSKAINQAADEME